MHTNNALRAASLSFLLLIAVSLFAQWRPEIRGQDYYAPPYGASNIGDVVTRTANGAEWAAPSAGSSSIPTVANLAALAADCATGDFAYVLDQDPLERLYHCDDGTANTWAKFGFQTGADTLIDVDQTTGDIEANVAAGALPVKSAANDFTGLNTFSLGYVDYNDVTAPSNPSAGFFRLYADSGDGFLKCKNSAGASCFATSTITSANKQDLTNSAFGVATANYAPTNTTYSAVRVNLTQAMTIVSCTTWVSTAVDTATIAFAIHAPDNSQLGTANDSLSGVAAQISTATFGSPIVLTPSSTMPYVWLGLVTSNSGVSITGGSAASAVSNIRNVGNAVTWGTQVVAAGTAAGTLSLTPASGSTNFPYISCQQ